MRTTSKLSSLRSALLDNGLKFRPLTLPDFFIDHDKPAVQVQVGGVDRAGIVASVLQALGQEEQIEAPALA